MNSSNELDREIAELRAELERRGGSLNDPSAVENDYQFPSLLTKRHTLTPEQKQRLDLEIELHERELCRQHLATFVARMQEIQEPFSANWHIDLMCRELEILLDAVLNDGPLEDRRLMIQMPPRHTKSHTVSRCLPIWFLALNPTKEVIVTGYGQDFINEFGDWAKETLQHPVFQAIFPDFELRKDSKAKNRLKTRQGGGIRYAGAGTAITGRGAHLLVIDDPIKGEKEADSEISAEDLWRWFWGVARTRLHPGGAIVVLHTRWRVNDLIGRLLQQDQERIDRKKTPLWRMLNFARKAEKDEYDFRTGELLRREGDHLHPDRYGDEDWEELQESMPPRQLLALYQQKPVADEGNLFKREFLNFYEPTELPKNLYWFLSTDLAVGTKEENDYSCIWPYGVDEKGNIWWHPDFFHGREDAGRLVQLMCDYAETFDVMHINIEAGVIRQALKPALAAEMTKRGRYFSVVSPAHTADKRTRAQSAVAMCEMGRMFFPNITRVHMVVMPELLAFDKGEHDDIVDVISAAARNDESHIRPSGALPDDIEDEELEDYESEEYGRNRIPSLFSGDW